MCYGAQFVRDRGSVYNIETGSREDGGLPVSQRHGKPEHSIHARKADEGRCISSFGI